MKVNASELLQALSKVYGVVNDRNVVEEFRAFYLLPENGELKIAGTDSNMTLIERVPYEETENSDGSSIVVSTEKIMDVVKYAGEEIEFVYNAESEDIKLVTPKSTVTLRKHLSMVEDLIDFSIDKEEEFVDEIEVKELKTILSSLASVIDSSANDPSFKTIIMNGEKAIVGDDSLLTVMECETKERYEFSFRVIKQVLSLLNGLDPESMVKLKKINDGEKVLLRTEKDVLSFSLMDVIEPDLDILNDFTSVASLLVGKQEFIKAIHLVKATSEEDKIYMKLREDNLLLTSFDSSVGEEARNEVEVVKSKIVEKEELEVETLASQVLKLTNIIDSEGVVLELDKEAYILVIREPKRKIVSAISVRL